MSDPRKLRSDATCMAPVDYDDDTPSENVLDHTCDKPATQERVIDGMVYPFCDAHAAECDRDAKNDPSLDVRKVP